MYLVISLIHELPPLGYFRLPFLFFFFKVTTTLTKTPIIQYNRIITINKKIKKIKNRCTIQQDSEHQHLVSPACLQNIIIRPAKVSARLLTSLPKHIGEQYIEAQMQFFFLILFTMTVNLHSIFSLHLSNA